jgi:hypothetical protein
MHPDAVNKIEDLYWLLCYTCVRKKPKAPREETSTPQTTTNKTKRNGNYDHFPDGGLSKPVNMVGRPLASRITFGRKFLEQALSEMARGAIHQLLSIILKLRILVLFTCVNYALCSYS